MQKYNISQGGARGWFIGSFPEALVQTDDFEVCYQQDCQTYPQADHYHKVITEVQLIIRGRMIINDQEFGPGDICVLNPGEEYRSQYLEPTDVVAIKFPSIPGDKYLLDK
jgi:hypothetical protein